MQLHFHADTKARERRENVVLDRIIKDVIDSFQQRVMDDVDDVVAAECSDELIREVAAIIDGPLSECCENVKTRIARGERGPDLIDGLLCLNVRPENAKALVDCYIAATKK